MVNHHTVSVNPLAIPYLHMSILPASHGVVTMVQPTFAGLVCTCTPNTRTRRTNRSRQHPGFGKAQTYPPTAGFRGYMHYIRRRRTPHGRAAANDFLGIERCPGRLSFILAYGVKDSGSMYVCIYGGPNTQPNGSLMYIHTTHSTLVP